MDQSKCSSSQNATIKGITEAEAKIRIIVFSQEISLDINDFDEPFYKLTNIIKEFAYDKDYTAQQYIVNVGFNEAHLTDSPW